jgi:hypothetical protein
MKRIAALLTLIVTATAFGAPRITLPAYVAALERIDGLLASKQLPQAKTEAASLRDAQIVWSKGTFVADASLLDAIANAQQPEGPHRLRLIVALHELRHASGMEGARGDRRLLEQIRAEQEPPELPRGGTIKVVPEEDLPLFERLARALAKMGEWIAKKFASVVDWLFDLFPDGPATPSGMTPGLRWIVTAVVIAIVLLVLYLAIKVLRGSRRATDVVESATPIDSKRDDDPLSRGATEWERHARDLAAAGKLREAIRAWYHAVLVTCYAAGILHFRKGRTNWEYVASLSPDIEWRPELIALTRQFEKEWYGAEQSTEDALQQCAERSAGILDALRRDMRGAA